MATILFYDGLPSIIGGKTEEIQAVNRVSEYFERMGHRTVVLAAPNQLLEHLQSVAPDVVVTDLIGINDLGGLTSKLEQGTPEHRIALIVITSITAECGHALHIVRGIPHLVEGLVIRPYCVRMTPDQQRTFRVY